MLKTVVPQRSPTTLAMSTLGDLYFMVSNETLVRVYEFFLSGYSKYVLLEYTADGPRSPSHC